MGILKNAWSNMILWGGDIKKLNCFPYVTWSTHSYLIDFDEILEALPLIKYGDIGLHRETGYLSNKVIPGFMKHGWIHVEDGVQKPKIIEAISEGVLSRNAIYPIMSDYIIILSPKDVTDEERKGACLKAQGVVGAQYDVNFKFDIETELEFYRGSNKEEAAEELVLSEKNLHKYMPTFSCTEVVGYSWWHKREQLRIFRSEARGKHIIKPDSFLNHSWEIRWMSKSVTVDVAKKMGLHEEGLLLIERYLASK